MSQPNSFNINVAIGDRSYPLVVSTEQEEAIRKAAKSLNEKMLVFRENYAVTDKVDLLAMAALEFATENAVPEPPSVGDAQGQALGVEELAALQAIERALSPRR